MNSFELTQNTAKTIISMVEQTGMLPGSPTGRCSSFMISVLTGENQNFIDPPRTRTAQEAAERAAGIIRAPITAPGFNAANILRGMYTQRTVGFDALLVRGQVIVDQEPVNHIIALATHEWRPIGIIDSLLPGGILACRDMSVARRYLEQRFIRGSLQYAVAIDKRTQELQDRRTNHIYLESGIVVSIPPIGKAADPLIVQ